MSMFVRLPFAVLSAAILAVFSACSQSSSNSSQTQQPAGSPAPASTGSPFVHIRGTVANASASVLAVKADRGTLQVTVLPSTAVAGVVPGSASDIKPNTFIGAANVPSGGSSRALEVVVFPNSMRGTGEGDYAWDLQANGQSSMMTNGSVSRGSMMTNGTVSHASASGPLTVTVTYKGGSKRITVPAGAPIVRVVPGDRSLLKPGAHVFIVAKPAGARPVAARIIVGEQGAVPPM